MNTSISQDSGQGSPTTVFSIGYRDRASTPRAAGRSAATSCVGTKQKVSAPQQLCQLSWGTTDAPNASMPCPHMTRCGHPWSSAGRTRSPKARRPRCHVNIQEAGGKAVIQPLPLSLQSSTGWECEYGSLQASFAKSKAMHSSGSVFRSFKMGNTMQLPSRTPELG